MTRYPLSGRVALVTGAGNGLGAATAAALADRGARVVVTDLDESAARRVAARLPAGRAVAVGCDVTRPNSLTAAVDRALEGFGTLDVVMANAGVLGPVATLRALTPDQVNAVLAVNVRGVLHTVAATVDHVARAGGQFVLVSSVFAFINGAGAIPYAMGKAAVEQLGRGLRVELAGHGVTALTAYFALIDTGMIGDGLDADPAARALLASAAPEVLLRRISPESADAAIVRGLEQRCASVTRPARWRPIAALRGVLGPALDARLARNPATRAVLVRLDAARSAPAPSGGAPARPVRADPARGSRPDTLRSPR